jgi:hypothetical protein
MSQSSFSSMGGDVRKRLSVLLAGGLFVTGSAFAEIDRTWNQRVKTVYSIRIESIARSGGRVGYELKALEDTNDERIAYIADLQADCTNPQAVIETARG